jgi:hypothetical protein
MLGVMSADLVADPFAAPADAEMPYIPAAWRPFAVRADSLVIDVDDNVKLHGDKDLSAQQASLKDWQFTRMIIVRRANRQVIIGNGSVLAAMRNGWEYVPVDWRDLTEDQARALGATDNMVGTLADWNEQAIERLLGELPALELPELSLDLGALSGDLLGRLEVIEEPSTTEGTESTEEQPEVKEPEQAQGSVAATLKPTAKVVLSHRILVICPNEATQIELMSELMNRGLDCRVSTIKAN